MFLLVLLTSTPLVNTYGRRWAEEEKKGLVTGALLFIKTQTRTHPHTHAHKSVLSKIISFKCLFENQELLHEKN